MLGTRIAMLRKSSGLSQQELAKQLGVSASAVGMYEQGRREPPCQILVALARIFHVSTDFLLTGELCRAQDQDMLCTCQKALQKACASVRLVDAQGRERTVSQEDLALLLAAVFGGKY